MAKETVSVAPDSYSLRSFREQELDKNSLTGSWVVALCELVDNAFGKHRGNASVVNIGIDSRMKRVWVWDNGQGVFDLKAPFKLGVRDPHAVIDDEDLGQYGVGGTNACLWMGTCMEVKTIRERRYGWAFADWNKMMNASSWNIEQNWRVRYSKADVGYKPLVKDGGTLIHVSNVDKFPANPGKMWPKVREMLSRIYAPALRDGRKIIWHQLDSTGHRPMSLSPWEPDNVVAEEEHSLRFSYQGKKYDAMLRFGYSETLPHSDVGIAVEFSFRQIKFTKSFFREYGSRTSGVYGTLTLGSSFKGQLSRHKLDLKVPINEALEELVYTAMKDLLEERAEAAQNIRMEKILDAIAGALNQRIRSRRRRDEEGDPTFFTGRNGDEPTEGDPNFDIPALGVDDEDEEEADVQGEKGGIVKVIPSTAEAMEGLLCFAEWDDVNGHIVVRVNKEDESMEKALSNDPANIPFLHYAIADAAGRLLAADNRALRKVSPAFFDSDYASKLDSSDAAHAITSYLLA